MNGIPADISGGVSFLSFYVRQSKFNLVIYQKMIKLRFKMKNYDIMEIKKKRANFSSQMTLLSKRTHFFCFYNKEKCKFCQLVNFAVYLTEIF